MLLMVAIQSIMLVILWITLFLLTFKSKHKFKSLSPFECGYNVFKSKMPLSIHFSLIMFLFLLFDIELSILITSTKKINNINKDWITAMFTFTLFMIISVVFEMMKKSMKWK